MAERHLHCELVVSPPEPGFEYDLHLEGRFVKVSMVAGFAVLTGLYDKDALELERMGEDLSRLIRGKVVRSIRFGIHTNWAKEPEKQP